MPNVLAFDLGGSSLRLAIVAEDGAFLASARRHLHIGGDGARVFETDPMLWWAAFQDCCIDLADQGHDFGDVDAIAGCGFTRTQVFLDKDSQVIRPAITFQDSRSTEMLEEMRTASSDAIRQTAAALGPYDPLARLLWLKGNEPENWTTVHKVIEPKDFLNLMLTGIAASDRISQTPMKRSIDQIRDRALANLGISAKILPHEYSPFALLGKVRQGLSDPLSKLADLPVYCGSIDTWSCVLGSGALAPGVAYNISGTSDVFGVMSDQAYASNGLLTVQWGPDLWQLGGPSQGAATLLQWGIERFAPNMLVEEALNEVLLSDHTSPLFLPFLDGERTPYWDPDLRGAFLGLSTKHEAGDFLLAVAEGMNYLSKEVLARAEKATGSKVSHICFSGGLSQNPLLCQLKADVMARPVHVPANQETGLLGASQIPFLTLDGAFVPRRPDGRVYKPGSHNRAYHDQRFVTWRRATEAVRPISHSISNFEKTKTDK